LTIRQILDTAISATVSMTMTYRAKKSRLITISQKAEFLTI